MNKLVAAANNSTVTANGMPAYKSTGDYVLDLFAKAGSSRSADLTDLFNKSLAENKELTLRTMLWARDVRGGAGERETFRSFLKEFAKGKHGPECFGFIKLIPEVGRWDDLHTLFDTPYEGVAIALIGKALAEGNQLAAKWTPRQGPVANKIRKGLNVASPKAFRKLLVSLTNVVEQKMCAKLWDEINYSHVPSIAAKNYAKAFAKHNPEGYAAYKAALVKGTAKINASAIFPHDVIKSLYGDSVIAEAQWKALPDYLANKEGNILPVIDVSGSMSCAYAGPNLSCMDVAVSLGLYMAERIRGKFKDTFMTFHTSPRLETLKAGSLSQRVNQIRGASWGGSTDIARTFDLVLNAAKSWNLPESEMPTEIVILSDMQFNQADRSGANALQLAQSKYAAAGYKMPKLVFWNISNGAYEAMPINKDSSGAVLVSGFSPSILKTVLGTPTTPVDAMLDTIMQERYNYLSVS